MLRLFWDKEIHKSSMRILNWPSAVSGGIHVLRIEYCSSILRILIKCCFHATNVTSIQLHFIALSSLSSKGSILIVNVKNWSTEEPAFSYRARGARDKKARFPNLPWTWRLIFYRNLGPNSKHSLIFQCLKLSKPQLHWIGEVNSSMCLILCNFITCVDLGIYHSHGIYF